MLDQMVLEKRTVDIGDVDLARVLGTRVCRAEVALKAE